MHNELRAFLALCIYICIMCWKAIWKKNGKAVKGLRAAAETVELSEGTFWKFLHTTESCQNSCYLTPWLLYAYIYAQSEKAFNLQCKHSIVLTHVFFKKWTITPLKKSPSADFNGVPLCIRISDPLAVNSLSKGDSFPTRCSLLRELIGLTDAAGDSAEVGHPPAKTACVTCNATVKTSNNEKCA